MVEPNNITEKDVIECIKLCCDVIEDSKISSESNLVYDLHYDSLKFFELLDLFERKYNILIDEREFCKLATVCEVVLYLRSIINN